MTLFARYYDSNRRLVEHSIYDIEYIISSFDNRSKIADIIYNRYYERYLKIFFYESDKKYIYSLNGENKTKNEFKTEYKNGFMITASCCLLIETLYAFIEGVDRIDRRTSGDYAFNSFFDKAAEYDNELQVFKGKQIYKFVRNGLLHQGETYGKFIIRRDCNNLLTGNVIDANRFSIATHHFLKCYVDDLKSAEWDSAMWDNCRVKIRYIIKNSK